MVQVFRPIIFELSKINFTVVKLFPAITSNFFFLMSVL